MSIKGGYQIIDLKFANITEENGVYIPSIYDKIRYADKVVLLTNIIIDGKRVKDCFVTPLVVTLGDYVLVEICDTQSRSIYIDSSDTLSLSFIQVPQDSLPNIPEAKLPLIPDSKLPQRLISFDTGMIDILTLSGDTVLEYGKRYVYSVNSTVESVVLKSPVNNSILIPIANTFEFLSSLSSGVSHSPCIVRIANSSGEMPYPMIVWLDYNGDIVTSFICEI